MSQHGNNNSTTTGGHPPVDTMFTCSNVSRCLIRAIQAGPFYRALYVDSRGEVTYGDNGLSRLEFLSAFWEQPDELEVDPVPVQYRNYPAAVPQVPPLTMGFLDNLADNNPTLALAPVPATALPVRARARPSPYGAIGDGRPRATSNGPVSDSGHQNEPVSDSFMKKLLPKLQAVADSANRAEFLELTAASEPCE